MSLCAYFMIVNKDPERNASAVLRGLDLSYLFEVDFLRRNAEFHKQCLRFFAIEAGEFVYR